MGHKITREVAGCQFVSENSIKEKRRKTRRIILSKKNRKEIVADFYEIKKKGKCSKRYSVKVTCDVRKKETKRDT